MSRQVLVDIVNNIFGQNWILLPDEKGEGEKNDGEERTEEPQKNDNQLDWKFVMPSRKAVRQYMQDAAALNFQHVAGGVITLGTDDTIKLSRRTAFDVKTGIVTVVDTSDVGEKRRKTFS